MIEETIKFLGGSAILLGAVAWLIRSIISQGLSKDIAVFKTEIQKKVLLKSRKYLFSTPKERRLWRSCIGF